MVSFYEDVTQWMAVMPLSALDLFFFAGSFGNHAYAFVHVQPVIQVAALLGLPGVTQASMPVCILSMAVAGISSEFWVAYDTLVQGIAGGLHLTGTLPNPISLVAGSGGT